MRIAATSIVNVNVSAASLDNFVGSILSWRRQLDLEQKTTKLNVVSVLFIYLFFSVYLAVHENILNP